MAWFRNHYVCLVCDGHWIAEGTEIADADCPHCRAYDVTAYRSDDLSVVVAKTGTKTGTMAHTEPAASDKDLVAALKATAEKMRGKAAPKVRPVVRAKGRGAARVAVH